MQRLGLYATWDVLGHETGGKGAAIDDFMRPDRIVVGVQFTAAADTMGRVYSAFANEGRSILVMDRRSQEMTKHAANVMLATRISLFNPQDMADLGFSYFCVGRPPGVSFGRNVS